MYLFLNKYRLNLSPPCPPTALVWTFSISKPSSYQPLSSSLPSAPVSHPAIRTDRSGCHTTASNTTFIYPFNTYLLQTFSVPENGHLFLTRPLLFNPLPAAIPSLLLPSPSPSPTPTVRLEPELQELAGALIAPLSSVTSIGGDISRARSCIPVAAYSPCHRRSSKLSPVES